MSDNKLYVTAGLVAFDSYSPTTGAEKFFATAGLIPIDWPEDMKVGLPGSSVGAGKLKGDGEVKGLLAGISAMHLFLSADKKVKAKMSGTSSTGVIMVEYYRAMFPRQVFLYDDTRRKITED